MDGGKEGQASAWPALTFPKACPCTTCPLQGRGRDSVLRFPKAAGRPGLCIPARSEADECLNPETKGHPRPRGGPVRAPQLAQQEPASAGTSSVLSSLAIWLRHPSLLSYPSLGAVSFFHGFPQRKAECCFLQGGSRRWSREERRQHCW